MAQGNRSTGSFLLEFLAFDRIIAGEALRLVYWIGLGLISLFTLATVGASVGLIINDGLRGVLLAIPGLIIGVLVSAALVVIWRAFCELFGAVISISQDLRAMREQQERDIFRR